MLLSTKIKQILSRVIKPAWKVILIFFTLGALGGFVIANKKATSSELALLNQIRPVRQKGDDYGFINPLITYSIPNNKEMDAFMPLQASVSNYINTQTQNGSLSEASVYFRDLNLGRWMGINENAKYDPASMLKVALMIAYYKQAESNPGILNKNIVYTKALDNTVAQVPFQAASTLQIGKTYTIEQLIEAMIISSDNGAKNALLANIDNNSLNEVYTDLGIDPPTDTTAYTISAKSYSLFFRILYDATYLNEDMSEKALELLNQAQYKDGLVAGVPVNTRVAQKFGEHVNADASGNITSLELHDCGIIYYPNHPYLLCVMTKGANNIDNLTSVINNISQIVYKSVDSGYNK